MINPIGSVNGYVNVFNNNSNLAVDPKGAEPQPVGDTVSINSTSMMDEEAAGIFNDIMRDLAVNPTEIADLHSG